MIRVFFTLAPSCEGLPAKSYGHCGLVEFALVHINGAAGIKTKNFVGDVLALNEERESGMDANAELSVKLEVGIEIDITCRAFEAEIRDISEGSVLILIYHRAVVGHSYVGGDAMIVIAGADVERVGSLALKRGAIDASG